MVRLYIILVSLLLCCLSAQAQEVISEYNVDIVVHQNADFLITETLTVISEGKKIRRGIFRDLPRTKLSGDVILPYQYNIKSVTRNGEKEPFSQSNDKNAKRVLIGDENVFLRPGQHEYVIIYTVKNEVLYFDDFDEVHWNVIGHNWAFPVLESRTTIHFPQDFRPLELNCFTGKIRSTRSDCIMSQYGSMFEIDATHPLNSYEAVSYTHLTLPTTPYV